jgi:bla regulator protein BlaR1
MIPNHLSATWPSLVPALGNHLWQSTVFVTAAGLLTLVLRKNHARVRYWLWLAASVKFLIPFSLLAAVGSYLPGSRGAAGTNAAFVAIEQVSLPFTPPTMPVIPQVAASTALTQLLPALFAVVWLCGFLAVISHWYFRWRRVSAAIREAVPLQEGREVQALRRLERTGGIQKATEMLLSGASLEPGVFGITRPVLLWPEGISERLEDAHLEAILAHELWHVRRRDNLAAALHMVVEAIFWFYPLVWWMGARLLEERERACDEEVLESGSDRQVYAESILKICEFCLGSPLACVSGVTGADLKKRMAYIMTKNLSHKLDFGRKLLLSIAGLSAVAAPITFGLLHSPQSRAELRASNAPIMAAFKVSSVQPSRPGDGNTGVGIAPGRITLANWTVKGLLLYAYNLEPVGGPGWVDSQKYDVDLRVNDALAYESGRLIETNVAGRFPPGLRHDQLRSMLQSLLADEFKLRFTRETRQVPIYALVLAKDGPKLHQAKAGDTYAHGILGLDGLAVGPHRGTGQNGRFTAQALPMSTVAQVLSEELHRTVRDETGLTGEYDFALEWTPIKSDAATEEQQGSGSMSSESVRPSIFTAIQEQLGLKLESRETTVEVLVIDHAEEPAESQSQSTTPIVPAFESASIKPNTGEPMAGFTIVGKPFNAIMWQRDRLMATNFTLHALLRVAYGIQDDQISGGPDWFNSEGFDVEAKIGKSTIDEMQKHRRVYGVSGRTLMLQQLLSDRFKLLLHRETRDLPVFALVITQNGPKIHSARPGDTYADGLKCIGGRPCGGHQILESETNKVVGQGIPLSNLVELLSEKLGGRIVLDKTGLTGDYDFTLRLAPEAGQAAILTAVEEQLGLKLEPQKAPTEVLVIDHAEKPLQN